MSRLRVSRKKKVGSSWKALLSGKEEMSIYLQKKRDSPNR